MPAKYYTPTEAKLRRLELVCRACEIELRQIVNNEPPVKKRGPAKGTERKRFLRDQPDLVRRMHAEHLEGVNLTRLEQKFGYRDANIKAAFLRLNLEVRLDPTLGRIQKSVPRLTDEELRDLVRAMPKGRMQIPVRLRWLWREWPLEKRWWFIQLLAEHHGWPCEIPDGPYSTNFTPFHYGTPAAHDLMRQANAGLTSREFKVHLKINSRGVIFDGHLWCWVPDYGYVRGRFTKSAGRKVLHREIFKKHHGPIPSHCVVRHADGNPNNLDPANLVLATKNDVARENQAAHHLQKSRLKTTALLQLNQKPNHELARLLGQPRSRGTRTHAAT